MFLRRYPFLHIFVNCLHSQEIQNNQNKGHNAPFILAPFILGNPQLLLFVQLAIPSLPNTIAHRHIQTLRPLRKDTQDLEFLPFLPLSITFLFVLDFFALPQSFGGRADARTDARNAILYNRLNRIGRIDLDFSYFKAHHYFNYQVD